MFTHFKRKKSKKRIFAIELELKEIRKELELLKNNDDRYYDRDEYKNLLLKRTELRKEMQSILNILRSLPFPK